MNDYLNQLAQLWGTQMQPGTRGVGFLEAEKGWGPHNP